MAERIHLVDNLKGILILLVVVGHFLIPLRNDVVATQCIFQTIYLFHMPLFVFISGFLAKRVYTPEKGLRVEKVLSLLLLGFIFMVVLAALSGGLGGVIRDLEHLTFGSTPWYLIALAWWYLLTPILYKAKPLPAIIVAVAIGLCSGYVTVFGDALGLMRTCTFLPFFVMGYYMSTDRFIAFASSKWAKAIAVAGLLFVVVFCYTQGGILEGRFSAVYGNTPYASPKLDGMASRLLVYLIAVVLSISVICITPRKEIRILGYFGKNTLPIYVFHRIAKSLLAAIGFFELPLLFDPVLGPIALILLSFVLAAVCSLPIFRIPLDAVLRCKWRWLLGSRGEKGTSAG